MRCFLVFLLLPAFAAAAEPAQARRPAKAAPATDGPDFFAGYSFLRSGDASLNGVQLSASVPFRRSLRLVADVSGHYGSFAGADLSQINLLVGGRYVWHRNGSVRPFGQALVGGTHTKSEFKEAGLTSSETGWGGGLGAGVDYRLTRRWAARGEADLLLLHSGGGWDSDPRLSIGVVYRP